jgi:hypothetical protein
MQGRAVGCWPVSRISWLYSRKHVSRKHVSRKHVSRKHVSQLRFYSLAGSRTGLFLRSVEFIRHWSRLACPGMGVQATVN